MAQLPLVRLLSVALVTIVFVLTLIGLSTHRLIHRASHDLEGQEALRPQVAPVIDGPRNLVAGCATSLIADGCRFASAKHRSSALFAAAGFVRLTEMVD